MAQKFQKGMARHSLRLGLIGAGRVAQHYISVLQKFRDNRSVSVSYVVDPVESKAAKVADRLNAKALRFIADMDPQEVDLALVLTPSGTHEECSRELLLMGVPTLCEKPIGLSVVDVEQNIALSEKLNLPYGGVFQNRYNRALLYAKRQMVAGRFGKLISASLKLHWCREQSYYEDGWHGTWHMDGGVINQQAIHHIDAMFYIIGKPMQLTGFGGRRVNVLEAEDTFVGAGQIESGAFFTVEATTAARPKDIEAAITLLGERGNLSIGGIALNKLDSATFDGVDVNDDVLEEYSTEVETGYGDGHWCLMEDIVGHWLQNGVVRLPLSAEESLETVKYVHAFYAAAELGTKVELDNQPISKVLGVKHG